jgi:hypothetical protein
MSYQNQENTKSVTLGNVGNTLPIDLFSNQFLITSINLRRNYLNQTFPVTNWKVVDGNKVHFLGENHILLAIQYTRGKKSGYVEMYTDTDQTSLSLVETSTLLPITDEQLNTCQNLKINIYNNDDQV